MRSVTENFSIDREGRYVVFPFADPPGDRFTNTSGKGEYFRERFVRYCLKKGVNIEPIYGSQLTAEESIDLEDAIEIAKRKGANHIVLGRVTKWPSGEQTGAGLEVTITGVYSRKVVFSAEASKNREAYSYSNNEDLVNDISREMAERACR